MKPLQYRDFLPRPDGYRAQKIAAAPAGLSRTAAPREPYIRYTEGWEPKEVKPADPSKFKTPEIDWNGLLQSDADEDNLFTGSITQNPRFILRYVQNFTGPSITGGSWRRRLVELRRMHEGLENYDPAVPGSHVPREKDKPRELTELARRNLSETSPEQRADYTAAIKLRPLADNSKETRERMSGLRDRLRANPNALANDLYDGMIGVLPETHRAALYSMRDKWERDNLQPDALTFSEDGVSRAKKLFEPQNYNPEVRAPYDVPQGTLLNPALTHLQESMRRLHFRNGYSLLPVTTESWRRIPDAHKVNVQFGDFHEAARRLLSDKNYTDVRPEPAEANIDPQHLDEAFAGTTEVGTTRPPKMPRGTVNSGERTIIDEDENPYPLWHSQNSPVERRARAVVDLAHAYETECTRRGIAPHPLSRELYTVSPSSGRGTSSVVPNPRIHDTSLSSDYDLELVPRSFDPDVDKDEHWSQRLRSTPWTAEEERTPGLRFDDEAFGRTHKGVLTLGHLLTYPATLVHNTFPALTRFEVSKSGLLMPRHYMQGDRPQPLDEGGEHSEIPRLESPRLNHRTWDPLALHSAFDVTHMNEMFGTAYGVLSNPELVRNAEGHILWPEETGYVPGSSNPNRRITHRAFAGLQEKMRDVAQGVPRLLTAGNVSRGLSLQREYAGAADSLLRTVIPKNPEDSARGMDIIEGMRNIGIDTQIRSLLENVGNPGQNAHKLSFARDWSRRLDEAHESEPGNESLSLLKSMVQKRLPDLTAPPGIGSSLGRRERNEAGRIIVSNLNGRLRDSMLDRLTRRVRNDSFSEKAPLPGSSVGVIDTGFDD